MKPASMLMYFFWYLARGASGFVLPLYLYAIGLPVVEVGVALGFTGVGVLIFEAAWGFIIDRVGVARTLPGVAALGAGTFAIFPFVNTAPEAYAASFFLGMTSPVMVVIGRYVVVGGEASGWGAGFGVLGAVVSLGFGLGALGGGVASARFGYGDVFYFGALLTMLAYPIFLLGGGAPPRETAGEKEGERDANQRFDWRTLGVMSVVSVPLYMGAVFYTGIMQLVVTQTPSISATNDEAAVMVSLFAFSNVFFQPLLGAVFARRAKVFIPVGLVLNLGVFLALTQVENIIGFDALAIGEAFCFSMVSPLSLSLLMVRTPRRFAGRMMGMYGAAEDVGITLGPVVGAFVWATFGVEAAYLSIGLPMLGAMVFYLLTLSRRSP